MPEEVGLGAARGGRSVLLTASEVVELLDRRVSTKTLANWRSQGLGPKFKKLGNRVFYPLAAVEECMEQNEFSSTRDYAEKRAARTPEPADVEPPASAVDALIAEFDTRVSEMRELLVARLAELAVSPARPKRPRGRPPGSRDKAPRRKVQQVNA
jgi:hypothetical protein